MYEKEEPKNIVLIFVEYKPLALEHSFLELCMLVRLPTKPVYLSVALVDMGSLHLLAATVIEKQRMKKKHIFPFKSNPAEKVLGKLFGFRAIHEPSKNS